MGDWRDISDGPFATGAVLHVDRQGDEHRVRVWHHGALVLEATGATAVGALVGIGHKLRELGRSGTETEIITELQGMHDAIRRELLTAVLRD